MISKARKKRNITNHKKNNSREQKIVFLIIFITNFNKRNKTIPTIPTK